MAWPDSHGSPVQTIYYDPDHGGTSSGTSANPYKTMAECITNLTYTDFVTNTHTATILCRNSTSTGETVSTQIDASTLTCNDTYYLVIEPDTGYEPSGTEPQIYINTASNLNPMFQVSGNVIVDGIKFKSSYVGSSRASLEQYGKNSIRNCMFVGDYAANTTGSGLEVNHSNQAGFVHNCLFFDCSVGLLFAASRADPDILSCTFADNNVALSGGSSDAIGPGTEVSGCLFYNNTTDGDAFFLGPTGYTSAGSYNATTKVTADAFASVTNWITSISTSDGVDVESPSTDDFRAASGGNLDDGDQSGSAPATDMFGTSRPQGTFDDIGYYEVVASGTTIPIFMHNRQQQ